MSDSQRMSSFRLPSLLRFETVTFDNSLIICLEKSLRPGVIAYLKGTAHVATRLQEIQMNIGFRLS